MIEVLSLPVSDEPSESWRSVPPLVAAGSPGKSIEINFDGERFSGLEPAELDARLDTLGLVLTACRVGAAWILDRSCRDRDGLCDLLRYLKSRSCHELTVVIDELQPSDAAAAGRFLDGAAYGMHPLGFSLAIDSPQPEVFHWASSPNLQRILRCPAHRKEICCPPRTRWLRVTEAQVEGLRRVADQLATPPLGLLIDG